LHDGVRTDVAGTAGNEDGLCCRRHGAWVLCSSSCISYRPWIKRCFPKDVAVTEFFTRVT
jgi:hypothetical protein